MKRALLYAHTLRHLRPAQVVRRLHYRFSRPAVDTAEAPPQRPRGGPWVAVAQRESGLLDAVTIRLLGVEGRLAEAGDWNHPGHDKLWLYHLHYHDDLNAFDADGRIDWLRAMLQRWIADNPPAAGNGWEAYPVSRRLVNWIKWWNHGTVEALPAWRHSLAVQARWLNRRLEFHLGANHLFANAKALVFAGAFFEGGEATRWLRRGLSILGAELPRQVLDDGGQYERSPLYHALALEDLLDLVNLARAWPDAFADHRRQVREWEAVAERMGAWLDCLCHPDGEIAFFNDAAIGIAPSPAELRDYAARLALHWPAPTATLSWLKTSGYLRLQRGPAVALLDVAPVGPDDQPGHAHADTLSFELSLDGARLLVNSGTSRYGDDAERHRQRGTAAHNTVCVAGEDSSEVWAGFRVARRARPRDLVVDERSDRVAVSCSHDGYRRLRGRPVHQRRWRMDAHQLEVIDTVSGDVPAVSRLYLHPEVRAETAQGAVLLRCASGRRVELRASHGATLHDATWHPRFGSSLPNQCIEMPLVGGRCTTTLRWQ